MRALFGQSTIVDDASMYAAAEAMRKKGEIRVQSLSDAGVFDGDWYNAAVYTSAMHSAEVAVASDVTKRMLRPQVKVDAARVERWLRLRRKGGLARAQSGAKGLRASRARVASDHPHRWSGHRKTFATHVIVRLWRAMGKSVVMCAPTGRAAQRLMEITTAGRDISNPVMSSAIHRLLEFKASDALEGMEDDGPLQALSYKGRFSRDSKNPIKADVVVVDELHAGLAVGGGSWPGGAANAQIVFVGDADQLPSVGPGSLLRDLLAAQNVPSIALTKSSDKPTKAVSSRHTPSTLGRSFQWTSENNDTTRT